MALDALRALAKSKGEALRFFKARIKSIIELSTQSNDKSITKYAVFTRFQ